jgi:hypothetical protein
MYIMPTYQTESPRWEYYMELDGIVFVFSFHWNDRGQCWYLDIWDSLRMPIISGLRLTPNYLLLKSYRAQVPQIPGDFIVWDTMQDSNPPEIGFDGLGGRFVLLYITKSELEAAA